MYHFQHNVSTNKDWPVSAIYSDVMAAVNQFWKWLHPQNMGYYLDKFISLRISHRL